MTPQLAEMLIDTPENKGEYELQISLVQEGVAWFEQDDKSQQITLKLNVV